MQAKPPKIIVTQTGIADTVETGVGKVEQELVLRKQEDFEGDRERMSILWSRMLFFIPANKLRHTLVTTNPSISIKMEEFFAGSFQCCLLECR